MRRIGRAAALVAAVTVGATACTGGGDTGPGDGARAASPDLRLASSLQPVGSCDDLASWLADEVAPRVTEWGLPAGPDMVVLQDGAVRPTADRAEAADAGVAAGGPGGGATTAPTAAPPPAGVATSGTNVQVDGVDEPDIVKTDGRRILTVAGRRLHLVSPTDGRAVAAVDLPGDLVDADLLLAGDRALVIGSTGVAALDPAVRTPGPGDTALLPRHPGWATTTVAEVDLSGDALTLGDTFVLDGSYVAARLTGDTARLVLRSSPADRLAFVAPVNGSPEAAEAARSHNRDVVDQADPEALLPAWRRVGADGDVTDQGALVACDDVHAPNAYAGFGIVSVSTLDLGDGVGAALDDAAAAGVLAEGDTVYASAEHLYVAAPEWPAPGVPVPLPEPRPGSAAEVAPGEGAPDIPTATVPPPTPGTDIHRFDLRDPATVTYELSGHVEGTLLDQFSMDEHGGHLRVATTMAATAAGATTDNAVTVLAPGDGALRAVGSVAGLGRGETIQSVRFIGDAGYLVTFERTDPLFTLDLADPAAPRVSGELEMLGFSAYLHPVGDGRLLGVGQDATAEGVTIGTQVALFDVRDPAAPTRLAQVVLPAATSGAEWDHHAFLWWADDGLATIPVSAYAGDGGPFEGLVGFSVDAEAGTLVERGRVTHPATAAGIGPRLPTEPGSPPGPGTTGPGGAVEPSPGDPAVPSPLQRAFVVGDRLWTLSLAGLATSDLATLGDTTFIPLG